MAEKMSVDQNDPVKDDSEESIGSSPEADPSSASNHVYNSNHNHGLNNPADSNNVSQENQQPKRKGGRKPVYSIPFLFSSSLFFLLFYFILFYSIFFFLMAYSPLLFIYFFPPTKIRETTSSPLLTSCPRLNPVPFLPSC